MCKVNPVLSVRTMTSIASEQELWRQPYIWRLPAYSAIASAQKKLDSGPALDIIIFTEIFNATPPRQDPQKPSASPAWGSQPTLAGCTARVVSEQQFLRPGGPGPGQVRDAPSSRNRPAVHQRVGGSLRILPAFVLSGPVSVSARWPGGVTSRKARSAQRPQLTAEVMEFVHRIQAADASLSPAQLAQAVKEQFGLSVHPRSIDRQLRRQKKRQ